jgi:hypothetical protein
VAILKNNNDSEVVKYSELTLESDSRTPPDFDGDVQTNPCPDLKNYIMDTKNLCKNFKTC